MNAMGGEDADNGTLERRLSGLRGMTFELLGDCGDCKLSGKRRAELIVALQAAANKLGEAQEALAPTSNTAAPTSTAVLEPAPISGPPSSSPAPTVPMTADAAIVLALAESTVCLAASREDEVQRWLRLLRQGGRVGEALQALGVAEGEPSTQAEPKTQRRHRALGDDPVRLIAKQAAALARQRGTPTLATIDVLFAVILHYGRLFDRALYAAHTSRQALVNTLASHANPPSQRALAGSASHETLPNSDARR